MCSYSLTLWELGLPQITWGYTTQTMKSLKSTAALAEHALSTRLCVLTLLGDLCKWHHLRGSALS